MFFILCDNWKTFFFIQTYRCPEVWCNRHVAALFGTSILKKVRISYSLFLQHYNAAIKVLPSDIGEYLSSFFNPVVAVLIFILQLKNVPHFLYKWNF